MRAPLRFVRRHARLRLAAASGAIAASMLSVAAFGQGAPAPSPAKDTPRESPAGYLDMCAQGNTKFAKHDLPGAIERYRAATDRFPDEPLAYALLGESLLASGNAADARAALARGAEAGAKHPEARVHVLIVQAVLEEHEGQWPAARTAWQAVLDAAKSAGIAGSATAAERIRVIDAVAKQDAAVDAVRKRIAATADGGVFSDPNKSSPDKSR